MSTAEVVFHEETGTDERTVGDGLYLEEAAQVMKGTFRAEETPSQDRADVLADGVEMGDEPVWNLRQSQKLGSSVDLCSKRACEHRVQCTKHSVQSTGMQAPRLPLCAASSVSGQTSNWRPRPVKKAASLWYEQASLRGSWEMELLPVKTSRAGENLERSQPSVLTAHDWGYLRTSPNKASSNRSQEGKR